MLKKYSLFRGHSAAWRARAATPATHVRRGVLEVRTAAKSSAAPIARFRYPCGLPTSPPRKRSEGKTTTDCRSKVAVVLIGDAGAMRNGDGQTAAHVGIRDSGKGVEALSEVMIRIERPEVEGARAGSAET